MVSVKEEARRLHKIYVRKAIESGLADSEAGRTTPVEDVRARFGLKS